MANDSSKKPTGREQALLNAELALLQNNNSWAALHANGKLRNGVIELDHEAGVTEAASVTPKP